MPIWFLKCRIGNSHRIEMGRESMRKVVSGKTEKQAGKGKKTGVIPRKKQTFRPLFDREI